MALCLASLAPEARVFPVLPVAVERVLAGLAWLWFINLFNFMDGIDGLAGSEAIAVALGYLLLASVAGLDGPLWRLALIVAASAAGYLFWNWHPAKVFMGDAGSIPLGFLLGWLMLDLALQRVLGRRPDPAALFRRPMQPSPCSGAACAARSPGRRTASISISARCWGAPRRPAWSGASAPPTPLLIALALVSVTLPGAGSRRGDRGRRRPCSCTCRGWPDARAS